MVLNQKCQNKVKSYLCSSTAASAELKEGERPDTEVRQTAERVSAQAAGCIQIHPCMMLKRRGRVPLPARVSSKRERRALLRQNRPIWSLKRDKSSFQMNKTSSPSVFVAAFTLKARLVILAGATIFPEGCLTMANHKYSSLSSPLQLPFAPVL